jgi:hypothetical protein
MVDDEMLLPILKAFADYTRLQHEILDVFSMRAGRITCRSYK